MDIGRKCQHVCRLLAVGKGSKSVEVSGVIGQPRFFLSQRKNRA